MDWYHFFIFLYRASQHLSFGTGGRRECGAGNNWVGRGCGAWQCGRCCGAQTSSRLNLGSSCYSYDGLWQGASPRPGNCWNSHRPPARRLQFPRPPSRVPPPPPECLMLHKGEAVARSRPRPPTLLVQLA